MSEPDISTLAKRLAEQNNVDWRALKGSGPSGKVVERDVLDYLARVMAGEEALDPTPEPLPDGMAAWPDQDLRSFQEGLGESASDMRDFRNDMAASVEESLDASDGPSDHGVLHEGEHLHEGGQHVAGEDQAEEDVTFERDVEGVRSAGAAYAAEAAEEAAGGNGAPIDEDIFLFDDDDDVDPDAVVGPEELSAGEGDAPFGFEEPPAAAEPAHQGAFGDAADWTAADGPADVTHAGAEAGAAEFAGASRDGHEADPAAAASAEPGVDFDAAGEPDDLLVVEGDDEPEAFPLSAGEGAGDEDGAGWQGQAEEGTTPEDEPAWAGDEIRIGRDAFGLEDRTEGASDDDLWVDDGAPSAEPAGADDASGAWASAADGTADVDLWEERDTAAASSYEETGAGFDAAAVEPADTTPLPVASEPTADAAFASDADHFATTGTDRVAEVGADLPAAGAAALGAAADAARALPLARTTTLLRRHIDVSALAAAQLAVGQELGEEEPLGASAFLLRAVAKAARDVAFDEGQVALAVIGDGVRLRRVDEAASRSFGSLVAELRDAGVEEDEIGLVAADLSGLDLDEAVLDLSAPVVTLGRILYDNQRGAYRSTLSLAGDLPLELGARLLARVADLLDAPVRLVL
ncbi:MAG: E3 binding domain-containing protein [Trueperaceae bacterium]